ncbi:hypothetical protein BBJ28_00024455 [Nothophytophthora sp. Chile5]|nr:hypothetical protein BBJ28_00024455 [Nothophytophthora sp. Chile5]
MMLSREANGQDDVDSVCKLDLEKVWRLIPAQTEGQASEKQDAADKSVREVMDLVSYLLYVRNHELEHQNQLSETLRGLEKQLERKKHIIQSMTTELETVKQNSAQQQNIFKAKEQVLKAERKALQSDKRCLEERKQAAAFHQSKESKLTKQIMENLERKKGELLFENEALAKSYDSLQRQLESLTSQYKKAVQLFLAQ